MQNYKQISDKYAFSLDNRQIAFLGTGILGMLLLFFLLGVLYGTRLGPTRGFSSAPPALADVPPPVESADIGESAPVEAAPAQAAPAEHVFELGEEDLSEASPTRAPRVAQQAASTQAAPEPKVAAPAPPKPAPVAAKPAEPEPTSGEAAARMSGNFTVQVGSFTRAGDAERLASKLEAGGYPAYVARGVVNGTTYYRVRVGKFQTRDEASRMASKVKRAEAMDAFATRVN